jgi:drug/metabolite transporter (DMT)-like permease
VHGAVLLFGWAGLVGKLVSVNPPVIVFARSLLAALCLGAVLAWRKELALGAVRGRGRWLVISGVVLAVHWLTFFQSIQVSSVAVGLLTYSSFPLFVTFLEPLFFPERLRSSDLLLALAVVAGLVLLTPNFDFGDRVTQGALWGTAAGLTFAILSLLNRKLVQTVAPSTVAAAQNAVSALVLLPGLLAAGSRPTSRDLVLLLALGLLGTGLAHFLFICGLRAVRAQVASVIAGLEPVYGICFALVILGEVPAARTLLGGALIFAAALTVTLRKARQ